MDFTTAAILIMVVFSTGSEVLRKKRRYPTRGRQPRGNGQPVKVPAKKTERKKRPTAATELPERQGEAAEQTEAVYAFEAEPPAPVREAGPAISVRKTGRLRPWSKLTAGQKRLQAGFVWSELWQSPLAYRRKRH